MIGQLIRAVVIGVIGFIVLCAAAILMGQRQEAPELFHYLGTCDEQPCYLGVIPGKTGWDRTIVVFENQPGMNFDPDINIALNPPGFRGSAIILASAQNETVDQIELTMRTPNVSIGTLTLQFGSPCAVLFTVDGIFTLYYPGMSIQVPIDEDTNQLLKPTSPASLVNLYSSIASCGEYDQYPGSYGFQPWKGFARYTR